MSSGNDPLLTCRACGCEFERPNRLGQKPTRCAPCKAEARKTVAREWARRNVGKGPEPRMVGECIACQRDFRRSTRFGKFPERCPECQEARNAETASKAQAAWVARRSEASWEQYYWHGGRSTSCRGCSATLVREFGKRWRNWCAACEYQRCLARLRAATVERRRSRRIVCIDCHVPVPTRSTRRQRCARCARARHLVMTRSWIRANPERRRESCRRKDYRRRTRLLKAGIEHFNVRDIYMRDRWKCGICLKKINPRFRSPHPMSPSIDHVIPVSEGGPHTRANCRAAHRGCNSRRSNRGGNEQLALIG